MDGINKRMYRKFRREQARHRADRELSYVVARTPVPKDSRRHMVYDLRRGQRKVYGGLFTYIDIAIEGGVPVDVLEVIPDVVAWYIKDQMDDTPRAA